jgi:hypothetical protein
MLSGQAVAGASSALAGCVVVLAQMVSVLVLPPVIVACWVVCIMHVIANRSFQSEKAVRE